MEIDRVLLAFGLTLIAGLATGIGSLLAILLKKTSYRFLSLALGFSAGFMIYVSMVDIFSEARHSLTEHLGEMRGSWLTIAAFFGGMLLIGLIDRWVPDVENPHHLRHVEQMAPDASPLVILDSKEKLMRVGLMSAIAIAIHNFPEGLATFTAALQSPTLGIAITVAIALHNIPEGIAVAVPIYRATGSRRKAFTISLLSGLSEPLGALIAWLILAPFINNLTMGIMFAFVAGIMVYISLDELLPSAREYGSPHLAIAGVIGGMMIMAVSLQLFL
jgi:ZIP family zinc transporter